MPRGYGIQAKMKATTAVALLADFGTRNGIAKSAICQIIVKS
jgi:hypothetical protein